MRCAYPYTVESPEKRVYRTSGDENAPHHRNGGFNMESSFIVSLAIDYRYSHAF